MAQSSATPMSGADILVQCLLNHGVDVVFAYPGGASMPIHQALTKVSGKLRTILPRHEQGGGFAAEGYARSTGKVGVCVATSGPGATNFVTCLADAKMDSTPIIAITGQVGTPVIGTDAFQETPIIEVCRAITKHHYLVTRTEDIVRVFKEAFYIASSGRPGPIIIDIPKDLQVNSIIVEDWDPPMNLPGYRPEYKATTAQLRDVLELISHSRKPIIYAGGGIISGEASTYLKAFAERTGIPVALTLHGLGGFPSEHFLCLQMLGMHGTVYANYAINDADLLLAFGVRFDDRVTGKVTEFAKHGKIVHIDIDPSEINKNKVAHLPIIGDIADALKGLLSLLDQHPELLANNGPRFAGLGGFPSEHFLCLQMLGMHGTVYANYAINDADLLLAFGVRFDDRVTGKVTEFAKHGKIVHIDIDPSEINKNKVAHLPIIGDIADALKGLLALLDQHPELLANNGPRFADWIQQVEHWRETEPLHFSERDDAILPQYAIQRLWQIVKDRGELDETIVTTGVGQHQMWAAQYWQFNQARHWVTSGGLGSMGFGLPSAMGAQAAHPGKRVIDIDGDGSFLMNIQELACCFTEKLPVKVLLLNNQHLGMVVQWEDRFHAGNRGHTYLGAGHDQAPYPDFVTVAKGFRCGSRRVTEKDDFDNALEELLDSKGPFVLDVMVPYQEHVLPMIPSGRTVRDIIKA